MFTSHGHHIDGTQKQGPEPAERARCGGPGLCSICSKDAQKAILGHEVVDFEEEIPHFPYLSIDQLIRVEALTIATQHATTKNLEAIVSDAKAFETYIRGEA